MPAVGGSLESVSIRGRNFPVAADADSNLTLGGETNELQPNGDGTVRLIKMRVPWQMDGLQLEINHDRADLEFLQESANLNDFFPVSATMASGVTYQGRGQIIGEFQGSSQSATATVTLGGPGEATQQ